MSLAKTYTAVAKATKLPILNGVAEVVMFFNFAAVGLALAWLATVWATAMLAGRRIWDAALVAASPILIFQIFTNFDALATALAIGGLLAFQPPWAGRNPDRTRGGRQAVPGAVPAAATGVRCAYRVGSPTRHAPR